MAIDGLMDAGFEVIEAAHAEAALVHLRSRAATIGLIFTDIDMPGPMNGLGLAGYAAVNWPWIRLLVTSGKSTPKASELPAAGRFLAKPYMLDDVVRHATDLLGMH